MTKDQSIANNSKTRVSGVILIDKPQGLTSQQVVSKVKYLLKSPEYDSKKAGHTGTLDPMATGLLPVCLGEATKFSHYQLDADKSYQAIIKLGQQTDTGDAEGQINAKKEVPVFDQAILNVIAQKFMGNILQTPPMYSALKKDGKKLYEYARQGIEIERPARPITIKALRLDRMQSTDEITLTVTCSKGTYVRVLGAEIAQALGTLGHLSALRRTQVGHLDIASALTLEAVEAMPHDQRLAQLLSIDACIDGVPSLIVSDSQYQRLHLGQRLNVKTQISAELAAYIGDTLNNSQCITQQAVDIRLLSENEQFLGIGWLESNGRLQPKKMIQC